MKCPDSCSKSVVSVNDPGTFYQVTHCENDFTCNYTFSEVFIYSPPPVGGDIVYVSSPTVLIFTRGLYFLTMEGHKQSPSFSSYSLNSSHMLIY